MTKNFRFKAHQYHQYIILYPNKKCLIDNKKDKEKQLFVLNKKNIIFATKKKSKK